MTDDPYEIVDDDTYEVADFTYADVDKYKPDGRHKAVDAFYEAGYITEEEAQELIYNDCAKRNECTTLILNEHFDDITLSCCENLPRGLSMLFHLVYDRLTGIVTS